MIGSDSIELSRVVGDTDVAGAFTAAMQLASEYDMTNLTYLEIEPDLRGARDVLTWRLTLRGTRDNKEGGE